MAETTARLLGVLSLLQSRPRWTGPELADRFGVTVRTIRRDVDRLRQLGYPIEAGTGLAGGYRLGTGGRAMPPLMLDRDEAVAVAVCLRSTATESLDGGGEAAIRALGKLEQLLPPTLRRQVGTIGSMTERLGTAIAAVSPELLVVITRACRDTERLKVRYSDAGGRESERTLDPYRVVSTARRWYLVAWDVGARPGERSGSTVSPTWSAPVIGSSWSIRRIRWPSCNLRSPRRRTVIRQGSSCTHRSTS